MKRLFYILLMVMGASQSLHAEEPRGTIFISPKYVKTSRFKRGYARNLDSKSQECPIPDIHLSIWPEFCLKHLQEDPEGCSEWNHDKNGSLQLSFSIDGSSNAQIDRGLINKLQPFAHLFPQRKRGYYGYCDYAWCSSCSQRVVRSVSYEVDDTHEDYDEDNEVYPLRYFIVYRCGCTGRWWLDIENLEGKYAEVCNGWSFCHAPTIYHGYFDWHHQTYFHHLQNFLLYMKENPVCSCYWPEIDRRAREINNETYAVLMELFEDTSLSETSKTFSPYLADRSPYGFVSGLLTCSFFYSHFREILLDLDQHNFRELPASDYIVIHNRLIDVEESLQRPFLELYSECLQKHFHPKICYERGMVLFHQGESLDALEDVRSFIAYAEKNKHSDLLTSDLYLKEGRLLSEALSYDEAIVALTKAIKKDAKNKDAYFERAIAYFEKGDFSKALSDYLASGIQPKKVDPKQVGSSISFGQGIALGILKGGQEATVEFVPSLLASFRGISRGIWACISHPIAVSQDMIDCASACIEFMKNNTAKGLLCEIVPELQECFENWNKLDDYTKGKYIGHVIGKYGVDIFIGSGSMKAMQLYRNLRKANAVMTLETASISKKLSQEVVKEAVKQEKVRETILKSGNLKIHWGQQGKHIPGAHNYIPGRSVFEHADPEKLIKNFAGKGKRVNHVLPGEPGYKEIVDFEEYIGLWKSKDGKMSLPTTRGTIHYGKNGCHIIPAEPKI